MNAAQVFQGTSGEVIVPPSSSARDRLSGDRPRRAYSDWYSLPGSTSDMYWSAVTTLVPNAVTRVDTISARAEPAAESTSRTIRASSPVRSITAPKHIAQITSHTVLSMLDMPPPLSSSSTTALPVFAWKPLNSAVHAPASRASGRDSSALAARATTLSGWNTTANTEPTSAPIMIVGYAGKRRKASANTRNIGSSRYQAGLNCDSSTADSAAADAVSAPAVLPPRPATVNIASAMTSAGRVVHSRLRMWLNSSAPLTAGARMVVSDNGESLSTK